MANTNEEIINQLKPLFKEHDYNQLYYKQDIVTYQINGTTNFYQAIRNVPRYVPITDRTYWNQLNIQESSTPADDANDVDYLCFTAQNDGANLCLAGMVAGVNIDDVFSLEYSTDKVNWETLEFNVIQEDNSFARIASSSIEFAEGDKVYFRGDNINGTTYVDLDSGTGYMLIFTSTTESPSYFAVSGDLQTIVDKTGQDKEHGVFGGEAGLFEGSSLYITTAPDLTATTLLPGKYANLFRGQPALTKPANMPSFTTSDLPDEDPINVGCFQNMYENCSSLEEPADFSDLTVTSQEDVELIDFNLYMIYVDTTFDITNDNGETLNGFGSISRITNNFQTKGTYYIANTLGNTEGFTYKCVDTLASPPTDGDVFCTITATSEYPTEDIIIGDTTRHVILGATGGETVTLNAYCIEGYGVANWYKQDGNSWIPMEGGPFTGTPPEDRHYTKEIALPTENTIDCYRPSYMIINPNLA